MGQTPAEISIGEAHLLAGVLCARLCHDIAGPVGALAACLDDIGDAAGTEPESEAFALARACVRVLTARLRLLRSAWGLDGDAPDAAALMALVAGLPGADRLSLDLSGLRTGLSNAAGPEAGRLAAALLLAAAAALPRGGVIRLSGSSARLVAEIAGLQASWPASLIAGEASAAASLAASVSPRDLPIPMACLVAWAAGMRLRRVSETTVIVEAERAPG